MVRGVPKPRIGIAAGAALVVALFAAAPAQAQNGGPRIKTVSKSAALTADAETVFTVSCPRKYFSGGASVRAPGASVLTSRPEGARRWQFRLLSPNASRRARATLRCVGLVTPQDATGVTVEVGRATTLELTLLPGETRAATPTCARGQIPLSAGFDREGFSAVSIYRSLPGRRGWRFRMKNRGVRNALIELLVRCIKSRSTARKGDTVFRHRFRVRRRYFSEPSLATRVKHSCRRGEGSLGGGYSLPPGDFVLADDPLLSGRRSVRWAFRYVVANRVAGATVLNCLSSRTTFRASG
jgi:hypothetical protein